MSNTSQESFMQNIADRLGRKRSVLPPEHPFRGAPDFWKSLDASQEDRIQLFMDNWHKVGGEARRFKNQEELKSFILDTINELSVQRMIRYDDDFLNTLNIEQRLPDVEMTIWGSASHKSMIDHAADADMGLIIADYAVSVTGSVVLNSNEKKGRSVSLLPTALIIVIPSEIIKTRLGEVMEQLNLIQTESMPAGIHFVSGPSRSADIENDLTIGVHGPGIVYALILE